MGNFCFYSRSSPTVQNLNRPTKFIFHFSVAKAKKQREYLKDILSNALALMRLNTEKKQHEGESATSEPTKQTTSNTRAESEPTEKQEGEKKQPIEKKSVVPSAKIPTTAADGISDAMEKEIEKAEAEIQKVQ